MTTTQTLAEFLLARYGEAEANAWRVMYDGGPGLADLRSIRERVLADIEAKRRMLTIADDLEADADDDTYRWARSVAEEILRALAQPYRDHPDWRAEWAL